MSKDKRHWIYGVWIGGDDLGYKKDKAYNFYITTYHSSSMISMIGASGKRKEYETLMQFLNDWRHIKRDTK